MIKAKTPQVYSGTGSAVDNYNKPKKQLENILNSGKKQSNSNWGLFDNNNQQHKMILSHLRTLQWVVPNEKWGEVPDLNRLSDFLKSDKSPVKKSLKKWAKRSFQK
ncbi:hypothetical protein KHA90_15770 [Flavobacterium psychroterrae]|uniref:Uncharacterized protein n=1 Tax=Flavobacterium psychroterrae TaxID=2133767 RepID=A0ABS5PDX1_9FLAO|nr:hypothetical protein [Flavobacterium psychroterrae]MBS7232477.1 hypothetical protein [Flavobacterium psychroterrae]